MVGIQNHILPFKKQFQLGIDFAANTLTILNLLIIEISKLKSEIKSAISKKNKKTTVSEDEYDSTSKYTLLKWGHFERAKPIFKILKIT